MGVDEGVVGEFGLVGGQLFLFLVVVAHNLKYNLLCLSVILSLFNRRGMYLPNKKAKKTKRKFLQPCKYSEIVNIDV
jgi:hypothetical protein